MDSGLKELKSVLRSLVVSSPSAVDVRSLLRDYKQMVGAPIPLFKYGYRDPLAFLKERCNDCFILHGASNNPTLTLIVPETLKHIDKFVQKQKSNPSVKFKGKRRSVPGTIMQPEADLDPDLVVKTFQKFKVSEHNTSNNIKKPNIVNHMRPIRKSADVYTHDGNHNYAVNKSVEQNDRNHSQTHVSPESNKQDRSQIRETPEFNVKVKEVPSNHIVKESSGNAVHNFLKKRTPVYNSQYLDGASSVNEKLSSLDDDSGRQTSSSNSVKKAVALEELKLRVVDLVASHPEGVWCTDLLRMYRERYGRELNFGRFGFTSVVSLVCALDTLTLSRPGDAGDWLLRPPGAPPPPPRAAHKHRSSALACNVDPDDALPGIDFDPDVFPVDCMHFMESIPPVSLAAVEPGALLDVMVGEVYSPSHFWLIRLGENYHIAMEQLMDEMTEYYNTGEGRDRYLATGAVRLGHYCSSVFDRDWHRSLIVKIMDSDTVKVRHVDYGTVDSVNVRGLKPLLRRWGQLPAQAVRARLAGVRPGAAGRRWPHAASCRFLQQVRDAKLVASVVAVDREEDILEVFLVNTSTDKDECISADLIRAGHADSRPDSCVRTSECYLFPRFSALESGATPNFGDISDYLRDGISLEFVDDYRRHVPDCLPPALPLAADPPRSASSESGLSSPPSPPSPRPSSIGLVTRVPLLPAASLPAPTAAPVAPARPASSEPALECDRSPRSTPEPAPSTPEPAPSTPEPAPSTPERSRDPTPEPPPEPASPCTPEPSRAGTASPSSPRQPTAAESPSGVTLSVSECKTFQYLSSVNPSAAHWFMVGALGRATSQYALDATAPEFQPKRPAEFRPNPAPEFRPNPAPEFRPNPAPEFRPNHAPDFRPNHAPEFRPNHAPEFRPNAAAPEFRPRVLLPSPASQVGYPVRYGGMPTPQYPPQRMPYMPTSPYGSFVPPGFRPPPGFGPC